MDPASTQLFAPMFLGPGGFSVTTRASPMTKQTRELCRRMGFPFATTTTALQLLHRFLLASPHFSDKKLFLETDIILACTLVAAKVQETVKKCRDLILAMQCVLGDKEMDYDNPEIEVTKRRVIDCERRVLEVVCFDFEQLKCALKAVVQIGKVLEVPRHVANRAWILADESYNSPISIQYPSHFIALACLYLACRLEGCDRIPAVLTEGVVHEYYCRLTGVIADSALPTLGSSPWHG
ncbi:RNA polymerase II C-terminal domain kinase beta subunit [Podochytrium sp. JEL0797]|nr:RNA polymerase II C-terminal domain kinase beta subunit [Podochytrium sp. JEL0797]